MFYFILFFEFCESGTMYHEEGNLLLLSRSTQDCNTHEISRRERFAESVSLERLCVCWYLLLPTLQIWGETKGAGHYAVGCKGGSWGIAQRYIPVVLRT